jgi:hypothetical protein
MTWGEQTVEIVQYSAPARVGHHLPLFSLSSGWNRLKVGAFEHHSVPLCRRFAAFIRLVFRFTQRSLARSCWLLYQLFRFKVRYHTATHGFLVDVQRTAPYKRTNGQPPYQLGRENHRA